MAGQRTKTRSRVKSRQSEPIWAYLADAELLDWRICDLGLKIPGTLLAERIERLYTEMD